MTRPPSPYRRPSEHYENFPVASWLCPARLRPVVAAIYWFARTADDLADEGTADADQRQADLHQYRADLRAAAETGPPSRRWPQVFAPLSRHIAGHRLPVALLEALLDAFEEDVVRTGAGRRYATDAELLDYCSRSANPVGRLLLHLYGIDDPRSLADSDRICTALQLINFWQDLGRDLPRARWYPSQERMRLHGVDESMLLRDAPCAAAAALVQDYTDAAVRLMHAGAPLACRLPGRIGWELRLVVQGGLRVAEKIRALDHATWRQRPRLGPLDAPLLLWRAWRMSEPGPQAVPA